MRLWVTGYRSYELNVFNEKDPKVKVIKTALKNSLQKQFDNGLEWVLTGGQLGVEQWCLEIAEKLKVDYPELKTGMLLPFMNFGENWRPEKKERLLTLKESVDFCAEVSRQPYQTPQQLKNWQKFMLSHTEGALMVYDLDHPGKSKFDYEAIVKRQEEADYSLELIDMFTLQDTANELTEE